ncbi:MAG: hypothetical protein M3P18_11030 [Actinomycetota bacterium]|nr:hypothetical protein [Actinomycetota bacterium]
MTTARRIAQLELDRAGLTAYIAAYEQRIARIKKMIDMHSANGSEQQPRRDGLLSRQHALERLRDEVCGRRRALDDHLARARQVEGQDALYLRASEPTAPRSS